jgi:hypothetical protein
MRFFKFIKIAWRLSGNISLAEEPEWRVDDATALRQFLHSRPGKRLRAILLNMVLRQNAHVVAQCDTKNLQIEAGYANGMRATVHTMETMGEAVEPIEEFTTDDVGVERLLS